MSDCSCYHAGFNKTLCMQPLSLVMTMIMDICLSAALFSGGARIEGFVSTKYTHQ